MKAKVFVTLKSGVLDPQGKAVASTLGRLGFDEVRDVRVGKYIELSLDGDDPAAARERVADMCRKLMANTVIEDFQVDIEDA
jgi:phosphoribosylformylglycinamidine synthase